jgi:hypothetical protein
LNCGNVGDLTLQQWIGIKQNCETLGLKIERSHFSAVALDWLVIRKAELLLISSIFMKTGGLIIPIDIDSL